MHWKLAVCFYVLSLPFSWRMGAKAAVGVGTQHVREHVCTPTITFLTKAVLFSNTSS